jgi:hypothetical protein
VQHAEPDYSARTRQNNTLSPECREKMKQRKSKK